MAKIFGVAVVGAFLAASPLFAGGKAACCATNAKTSASCMNLTVANLKLTPDQKTKLEKWQRECAEAGCTKQSRATFLKKAKSILSPEQYRKVQEQCDNVASSSETSSVTTAARGTGYFRHARTELPFRSVVGVQAAQGPFLSQPH